MNIYKKVRGWLLPLTLILFIASVSAFPLAAVFTYAGRSESASHVLTYTTGKLTWDSATDIMPNGVARLDLFSQSYENVQSANGERVVAPGTEALSIVRLKNSAESPIEYTAVVYRLKEEATLPVSPELSGTGFTQAATYPLPDGVQHSQVVRAVTGTLEAGKIQDFDIAWQWNYFDSDQRDQLDTALGDKAAFAQADEVTAGIYIVVTEDAEEGSVYPEVPQTGDDSPMTFYQGLMVISGILLLLLLWDRRKEKKCPNYSDAAGKR